MTSDGNSEPVHIVEPYVLDGPSRPVGEDDGFANKLGLSLIERDKDGGRSSFGGWHGARE
jgi:hypothetical protein